MRKIRYIVAMSVDGYIAGPTGETDWIVTDPDVDFAALWAQFDTVLMNASAKTAPSEKPESCLARQPILNKDENVLGYELLFRENSQEDRFNSDFEGGTRSIIDTLNVMRHSMN